jgi:hypothetical protein
MNPVIEMPMLDEEEYLVEPGDWTEGVAEELAHRLGIEVGDDHWDGSTSVPFPCRKRDRHREKVATGWLHGSHKKMPLRKAA